MELFESGATGVVLYLIREQITPIQFQGTFETSYGETIQYKMGRNAPVAREVVIIDKETFGLSDVAEALFGLSKLTFSEN